MITLFISFHYACLFISKHLRLVALFACQPRNARFGCMPPRKTALVAPSSAGWACRWKKNKILIIIAQFSISSLQSLQSFLSAAQGKIPGKKRKQAKPT